MKAPVSLRKKFFEDNKVFEKMTVRVTHPYQCED